MIDLETVDEGLKPYASEKQWEAYCLTVETGSHTLAADKLGCHQTNVTHFIQRLERNAAARGYFDKSGELPAGYKVKGTSTLYDGEGNARLQWVKTREDGSAEAYQAMIDGLKDDVPSCTVSPRAKGSFDDTLTAYPVGDHHIGMLAHAEEADSHYDLNIAEDLLCRSMERLTAAAPASDVGLVAILGDFLHFDGWSAVTPTSGNLMDADGRFYRLVRASLRMIRFQVECALQRHRAVHLYITIGNHDLASSVWLMEALAMFYEGDDRVHVDTSPSHFKYFRFGSTLIGMHHGHGRSAKPGDLPGIMAHDRARDWGETTHRVWWTGHIHNKQVFETPGCTVESFRILPPADAYASNNGYRAGREMQAIVFDRKFGETERHRVTPLMLESANAA